MFGNEILIACPKCKWMDKDNEVKIWQMENGETLSIYFKCKRCGKTVEYRIKNVEVHEWVSANPEEDEEKTGAPIQ